MAKKTPEELARGLVNILKEEGGVAWRDKLIYLLQNSERVLRNDAFYALTYARSEGLIEHVHNESWYPATMRLPGETRSKPEDSVVVEPEPREEPELTLLQEGLAKLVAERRAEQEEIRSTFDAAERYLQFRAEPFFQGELIGALRGILGVSQSLASSAAVHLVDAGFATKSYTDGTLIPVGYINPEDEVSGYGEYTAGARSSDGDSAVARGADLGWLLGSDGFQDSIQEHISGPSKAVPEGQEDPSEESRPWWIERRAKGTKVQEPELDEIATAELVIDGSSYTVTPSSDGVTRLFQLASYSLGFDTPFFEEYFLYTEPVLTESLVREYFEDYRLGRLTDTEHGWKR